ncbi:hypothetical protein HDK90DRAFT_332907 [Phyllosticta capitalensis]|uniref:Alpha-ketoglutarate-dependent dioxygenase AlkB-like domain-containing protein n=2 Tax=Phyllosticta capitalensis TaxID=121624 RepID=A0ABR1YKE3_9PEZI
MSPPTSPPATPYPPMDSSPLSSVPSDLSARSLPDFALRTLTFPDLGPIPFEVKSGDALLETPRASAHELTDFLNVPRGARSMTPDASAHQHDLGRPASPSPPKSKRRRVEEPPRRSTRIFLAKASTSQPADAPAVDDSTHTRQKIVRLPISFKKLAELNAAPKPKQPASPPASSSESSVHPPLFPLSHSELSPPTSPDESNILIPSANVKPSPRILTEEEQRLASITRYLIALSDPSADPTIMKPPPVGQPDVWADGRQALCETLPYFNAYQGAGYTSGGFAYAFMVDSHSSPRDYLDADVLITRAGGGRSRDAASGKTVQASDQSIDSAQVNSVRNSMLTYGPVAIISGDRNPQAPCTMPHPYNVLAWFKPAYIWAEKSGRHVVIKYRFEKLDNESASWWMPQGLAQTPLKLGSLAPPEVNTCRRCQQSHTRIYIQGWMCLQPQCVNFWKLEDGSEPVEEELLYDPRFLKQYTPWPHSSPPQPLKPLPMQLGSSPILGDNVSWEAGKGMACPRCGRCNSREAWKGWKCGHPACGYEHSLPHTLVPPSALRNPYDPMSTGYTSSKDQVLSPLIGQRIEFVHNYRIHYYTIPGIKGFIAHLIANGTVLEEQDGPDDMWTELQKTEIGLRRRPLQNSILRGPMLTQHFSVNYGMPYKFIASTESHSFTDACKTLNDARSRLNWAAREFIPGYDNEFNELLALGYFERQAIDFHDDGEKGLGPTIATLSLGDTSNMRIRMKQKHFNGVTKSGAYVDLPPVPGCLNYDERKEAHDELQQLRAEGELDAAKKRVKELPKELGLKKGPSKNNAKEVLNMFLRHGDIVIMHGADIQQYYEHAVSHAGKLRFALTCRYIDPESLKPADRPEYEVAADNGVYDGSALPNVIVPA